MPALTDKIMASTQKVIEAIGGDEKLKELLNSLAIVKPRDFSHRLELFKADVGEENYKLIASGPSLIMALDKWQAEWVEKTIKKTIRAAIPADKEITDHDIDCTLLGMIMIVSGK